MNTLLFSLVFSVSLPEEPTYDKLPQPPPPTQAQTQVADEVLKRVDVAGQWVSTTLEKVAEKLGTTVEYLWPTFVKRTFVKALAGVVGGFITILAGVVFLIILRSGAKRARDERIKNKWSSSDEEITYTIFMFVIPIACLVAGLAMIGCWSCDLIAPEPQALQDIVEAVRHLR